MARCAGEPVDVRDPNLDRFVGAGLHNRCVDSTAQIYPK